MNAIFDTSHKFFHCSQFIFNMNMIHNLLSNYNVSINKEKEKLTEIEKKL